MPADAIVASGSGALMLVVGSRGAGAFTALLLGSVSRYAASHASCPVVVVRDEAPGPHRLVGVGIGDPDHCSGALTFAFEEASLRRASLTAVHSWHAPQAGISRAGLVVIGRHSGHQGPGSVRHAVLNHAHGPVVTVPSA